MTSCKNIYSQSDLNDFCSFIDSIDVVASYLNNLLHFENNNKHWLIETKLKIKSK